MSIEAKANEVLWVEKYRPMVIGDTILPDKTKAAFKKFVADQSIPNLLLTGGPGVGKTTIAKAMLDELGCDYLIKNGSLNVNIDTLRYDISTFASAVSFTIPSDMTSPRLPRRFPLQVAENTSSLTRRTISTQQMFNPRSVTLSKSIQATVDSSLLVTLKIG